MSKETAQKTEKRAGQPYSPTTTATTPGVDRERDISTGREMTAGTGAAMARPFGAPSLFGGAQPFMLMQRMAEDMDRLFGQFGLGRTGFTLSPALEQSLWSPQVELFERGNNLVVRADLPGVKKEDLNIEVQDDVLTISGERHSELEENGEGFYRSERSYGNFYRSIPLPNEVKADQVNASFRDGVLEVILPAPKQEEKKAKKIEIR
ncbi:MAG TPA: Hsp20/alpha crystallin family protein [Gemmatimonadaceae bacterium]|nr:Hsp20/alpha crystallin family protein [Gemmatimonadaceae bacterium]